MKLSLSK